MAIHSGFGVTKDRSGADILRLIVFFFWRFQLHLELCNLMSDIQSVSINEEKPKVPAVLHLDTDHL